jgi:hypothetical protein
VKIEFALTDDHGRSYFGTAVLTKQPASISGKGVRTYAKQKPVNLPDHILALRDAGFFRQARTGNEVHAALARRAGYR